jgi:hypothetical protein
LDHENRSLKAENDEQLLSLAVGFLREIGGQRNFPTPCRCVDFGPTLAGCPMKQQVGACIW